MADDLALAAKERTYAWLRSQQRWHARRMGRWHLNQSRWYKRKANRVFTFAEIVVRTFRKHRAALSENVQGFNSLYQRLTHGR